MQRNLSHMIPGQKPKLNDYGQILKQMKDNPLPLPKAPNRELLEHEKKRQIEAKVYGFTKKLRLDEPGLAEEEVVKRVGEERLRLRESLVVQV